MSIILTEGSIMYVYVCMYVCILEKWKATAGLWKHWRALKQHKSVGKHGVSSERSELKLFTEIFKNSIVLSCRLIGAVLGVRLWLNLIWRHYILARMPYRWRQTVGSLNVFNGSWTWLTQNSIWICYGFYSIWCRKGLPLSRFLTKTLRVNKIVMRSFSFSFSIWYSESNLNYWCVKLGSNPDWRIAMANYVCMYVYN